MNNRLLTIIAVTLFALNVQAQSYTVANTATKDEPHYRIKVDANQFNPDLKSTFETAQMIPGNATLLGIFEHAYQAQKVVSDLNLDAKIQAYLGNKPIPMSESLILAGNQMKFDNGFIIGETIMNKEDVEKLLFDKNGEVNLTYRIVIGPHSEKLSLPTLSPNTEVKHNITGDKLHYYQIGNYKTKKEAISVMRSIEEAGLESIFVASYYNEKRVSTPLAKLLEEMSDTKTAKL